MVSGIHYNTIMTKRQTKQASRPKTNMSTTMAPVSQGTTVRGSHPGRGSITIQHRELIASPSTATISSFRINPVDHFTFPYLSTLATMYDKYTVNYLKATVVSSHATVDSGRWYMAWDPDSEDAPPIDTQAFMAMNDSVSMSIWQSGGMPLPPGKERYLSYFTDSLKDSGRLHFYATATGAIDLYLEYSVTLSCPNLSSKTTLLKTQYDSLLSSGRVPGYAGPDVVASLSPSSAKKFILAPGYWFLQSQIRNTAASAAGAWTVESLAAGVAYIHQRSSTATSLFDNYRSMVIRSDYGAVVTIGDGSATAQTDRCSLLVSQISSTQYAELSDAYQ